MGAACPFDNINLSLEGFRGIYMLKFYMPDLSKNNTDNNSAHEQHDVG